MTQLTIFDIIMTYFKCETSGEIYNFYFFFPASHKTILHEFFIFFLLALVLIVVVKNIKPK